MTSAAKRDTRGKILIIEDDADVRRGLVLRLKHEGFLTAIAQDGIEAIKVARQERPDAIILDLGLPAGDGFLVMERLKSFSQLEHIPVIVLSGRDPELASARAKEAGAVIFLQKPAENDALRAAIDVALDASQP